MFAGTDYSGRPGNYFAHALVTSTPGAGLRPAAAGRAVGRRDCGSGSPIGSERAARAARPAASRGRRPRRRPGVPRRPRYREGAAGTADRGLARHGGRAGWCCWQATMRTRTSGGSPPSRTCSASTSAPELTFTTYSHRPNYSRHHLIGILSGRGAARCRRELPAIRPRRREDTRRCRASPGRAARGHGGDGQRAGCGGRRRRSPPATRRGPMTGSGRSPPRPACSAAAVARRDRAWSRAGCPARPAGCRPSTPASSSACCRKTRTRAATSFGPARTVAGRRPARRAAGTLLVERGSPHQHGEPLAGLLGPARSACGRRSPAARTATPNVALARSLGGGLSGVPETSWRYGQDTTPPRRAGAARMLPATRRSCTGCSSGWRREPPEVRP